MRILFDQGTPVPLRKALVGHVVETAYEHGWSDLSNGEDPLPQCRSQRRFSTDCQDFTTQGLQS